MKQEQITLRCEDGQEAVVFTKYTFKTLVHRTEHTDSIKEDISYEINIQDDYVGGDYKGFFGRIKRAWRAFWDKPVVYTGIYCEDENKMRQFLYDCLELMDEYDIEKTLDNTIPPQWLEEYAIYCEDGSVTSNEELIKKGEW